MNRTFLAGGIVFYFLIGSSFAETVELEPVADAAVVYSPTASSRQNYLNGGKAHIGADRHAGGGIRGGCSMLRFDISKIPSGARIEKVLLVMMPVYSYPSNVYAGADRLLVYQLAVEDAGWVEGSGSSLKDFDIDPVTTPGVTGAYVNLESYTDENQNNGTPWLSGKTIGQDDLAGDEIGRYELHESGLTADREIEIPLNTGVIQDWLANPELAKAGLILWMQSDEVQLDQSRFAIFQSREESSPPRLVVTFRP